MEGSKRVKKLKDLLEPTSERNKVISFLRIYPKKKKIPEIKYTEMFTTVLLEWKE